MKQYPLFGKIVVVVTEADFMERINANTRTTILLCLVALMVATLLGLVTSRWITKPIMRLSTASKALARHIRTPEFARGDLFEKVEVKGVDELGVLASSFNPNPAHSSCKSHLKHWKRPTLS